MFDKYIAAAFALTLTAAPVSAAQIDIGSMGLQEGDTIATASGGVFYDDFLPILTSDDPFDPLLIDGFPGAIQFRFEGIPAFDIVLIDFDDPNGLSGNAREFEISASGDDGSNVMEFLLTEFSPNSGFKALFSLSFDPQEVDFAGADPFDFFSDRANDLTDPQDVFRASASVVELTAIAPVPLPAGLLLMGTALAGLSAVRRRKKAGA